VQLNPAKDTQYPTAKIAPVRFVIGIDTSELFVAKTGVRGANDLVWVGRAANYAAKLAAMPSTNIYVTSEVFSSMNDSVKTSDQGHAMWTAISWDAFDGRTVYRSSWWQSI
jgi:class 3 adenylate cyclase